MFGYTSLNVTWCQVIRAAIVCESSALHIVCSSNLRRYVRIYITLSDEPFTTHIADDGKLMLWCMACSRGINHESNTFIVSHIGSAAHKENIAVYRKKELAAKRMKDEPAGVS